MPFEKIERYFCNIPSLNSSIPITFHGDSSPKDIIQNISHSVSVSRIPPHSFDQTSGHELVDGIDFFWTLQGSDVLVRFSNQSKTETYLVDLVGLHWDFWKSLVACLSTALSNSGIVIFHAAAILTEKGAFLLPGESGAGKSSIAFKALEMGEEVISSELCFVKDDVIIAGNMASSIDVAGLEYFGTSKPSNSSVFGEKVVAQNSLIENVKINQILFPTVNLGDLKIREITSRRARMILYHNCIGELPFGQMVAHQRIPLLPNPDAKSVNLLSNTVDRLSRRKVALVSGHPKHILEFIKSE